MDNWILPAAFSILTSLLGFLIGRIRERNKKDQAIKHGLQAVLRFDLLQMYKQAKAAEGATLEDKATFEWMFAQYHQLGANGVMDHVHQEFINMETKQDE